MKKFKGELVLDTGHHFSLLYIHTTHRIIIAHPTSLDRVKAAKTVGYVRTSKRKRSRW